MGIFDGCLLASDIDGTLVKNNVIVQRAVDKIAWFVSEGGTFSLSTGRSVGALSVVLERLGKLVGLSVVANGGMIYDYSQKKIVYETTLPQEDLVYIKEVYERFPEIGIEIHSGEKVFVLRRNGEIHDHEVYERLDSSSASFEEIKELRWTKALISSDIPNGLEPAKALAQSLELKGSRFLNTTAVIDGRTRMYYEQVPQGISKASALNRLCELLKVKKGCYFAIGDYYNDAEMVASADVGAVTADAPDELKAAAKFVAGTAEQGAVADFIEYLATIVAKN